MVRNFITDFQYTPLLFVDSWVTSSANSYSFSSAKDLVVYCKPVYQTYIRFADGCHYLLLVNILAASAGHGFIEGNFLQRSSHKDKILDTVANVLKNRECVPFSFPLAKAVHVRLILIYLFFYYWWDII